MRELHSYEENDKVKVKEKKKQQSDRRKHWESNFIICTASDRGKPDPAVVCDSRCDHCRTVCRQSGTGSDRFDQYAV